VAMLNNAAHHARHNSNNDFSALLWDHKGWGRAIYKFG
jgi:hypothetical protein